MDMSFEISLQQNHICTEDCATTWAEHESNHGWTSLKRVPNLLYFDGKCPHYMKSENTYIQIADKWNLDKILNPDDIVIADTEIKIKFSYPLNNPRTFTFKSNNGFSRVDIINHICDTYAYIYKSEEETATKNHYYFTTKCDSCPDTFTGMSNIVINEDQTTCSVCLVDFGSNEIVARLPCGHSYHDICIGDWLKCNASCPMCRQIMERSGCTKCQKGSVVTEYVGVTEPLELKLKHGGLLNREESDGVFGIWGHDIGDLVIEQLTYNPDTKKINMFIGS